jgi:Uma2 family endonuclease
MTEEAKVANSQSLTKQIAVPDPPAPGIPPDVYERANLEAAMLAAVPNIDHIVTEDDTPVDNLFSEKQQRLLTEPLYSSWSGPGEDRPFLAAANVGVFYAVHQPPLVPDVFLSLDVQAPQEWWSKPHRSYFVWEFGKPPEVAIEIVSNQAGQEDTTKLRRYAWAAVPYYVIFDPAQHLEDEVLRVYELELSRRQYQQLAEAWLPGVGLGLQLWEGVYEGGQATWLRWCDQAGQLIPTGAERAEQAENQREQERQRAERLAAQLRALGVEPEA